MTTININTEQEFDEFLSTATEPVMVDFWAEWCGPCKRMNPVIKDFSEKHAGDVFVLKVDVDAVPELAQRYSIASIPTILTFDKGELNPNKIIGAVPSSVLEAQLVSVKN